MNWPDSELLFRFWGVGPDIPERWAERFPFLQQGIDQAAHSGALRLPFGPYDHVL